MTKLWKQAVAMILSFTLMIAVMPQSKVLADAAGTGWSIADDTLTITGDDYVPGELLWNDGYKSQFTKIVVAEGVTTIPSFAFQNFTGVTSITLPSTLTTIMDWSFQGVSLSEITIPESVTVIDTNAELRPGKIIGTKGSAAEVYANEKGITFEEKQTEQDTGFEVEENVLTITGDAYKDYVSWIIFNEDYKNAITKIIVEEGVTNIPDFAFQNLSNVTEVVLSDTVKTIGSYSFQGINLKELTIPGSVETIAADASIDTELMKGTTDVAKNYAEANGITYVDLTVSTYTISKDGTVLETIEEGAEFVVPDDTEYGYYVKAESGNKMYQGGTSIIVHEDLEISGVNQLTVTASEQAGIRIDGISGIRYQAAILSDNMEAVASDLITEGMLITANDIYQNQEEPVLDLTSTYTKIQIVNDGWYNNNVGTYCGSVVHVVESNYIRNFIGRAYVTINYANGETTTVYSNMTGVRSISGIANAIISAGDLDKFTPEQQLQIQKFAVAK